MAYVTEKFQGKLKKKKGKRKQLILQNTYSIISSPLMLATLQQIA